MPILDRYILNAFLRNLALVLLTLVALYSLIEFLEKVDDFIEHRAAVKYYLTYPLSHLPVILSNSLPMAVLLATFATIGGFSRSNQLTAMQVAHRRHQNVQVKRGPHHDLPERQRPSACPTIRIARMWWPTEGAARLPT